MFNGQFDRILMRYLCRYGNRRDDNLLFARNRRRNTMTLKKINKIWAKLIMPELTQQAIRHKTKLRRKNDTGAKRDFIIQDRGGEQ